MSGLWHVLRNHKFQKYFLKTFIIIVLLVHVPFIGLAVIVYSHSYTTIEEELGDLNLHNLIRVRDLFDSVFLETERMAAKISLDPAVELFMLSKAPTEILDNSYTRIQELTRTYSDIYDYIESIYVYSETNQYLITNRSRGAFSEFDDRTWYADYTGDQSKEAAHYISRKRNDIYPYYLSLIRPYRLNDSYNRGAIIVNLNVEQLGKLIGRTGNDLHEHVYMTDESGSILYSHDVSHLQSNLADLHEFDGGHWRSDLDQTRVMVQDGKHFFVTTVHSPTQARMYTSVFPLEHYSNQMHELRSFILALVIFGLIVNGLISLLIAYRTVKPMADLAAILKNPEEWAKRKRPRNISTQELFISSEILSVLDSKYQLEQQLEQRLLMLVRAQRVALQAQINPHFLYNTLDAIQWTAVRLISPDNAVSSMIADLSDMLRYSIVSDNPLVQISQEIEHAERYIEIMRIRFKDEFDVEWDISPDVMQCGTVRLTLQPLIENAFQHGIRPAGRRGTIRITGSIQDGFIRMEVADNGVGMNEETLEELNRLFEQTAVFDLSDRHIGLQNANHRIKLLFGPDYGLRVHSEPQQGTQVTIRIPVTGDVGVS